MSLSDIVIRFYCCFCLILSQYNFEKQSNSIEYLFVYYKMRSLFIFFLKFKQLGTITKINLKFVIF